jgi:divalent metal cation (Fe/Co/Zn/Cd) transporter
MAQVDRATPITTSNEHHAQLRLGVWIELITIVWMIIEATIAITTGYITHSISLQAFGIDSIIELILRLSSPLALAHRTTHPLSHSH